MTRRSTSRTTRRRTRRRRSSSAPPASQDPTLADRSRRTSSATTATAPSGTPASASSRYKTLGWRKAAIIMDDYSFGWTSAAGFIADFCAVGGKITKRVFPPLNTTDYSSYVRQLPPPDQVDGYFWVVGGTGTEPSLKAFEQAYGPTRRASSSSATCSSRSLGFDKVVAPRSPARTSAASAPVRDLKSAKATKYEAITVKWSKWIPAVQRAARASADVGLRLQLLQRRLGASFRASRRSTGSRRRSRLQKALPKIAQRRLPGVATAARQARHEPPGDPGPVPAAAGQERGRQRRRRRSSGSSRTSTRRSAALFKTRARRPAARSPVREEGACRGRARIKVVKNGVITTRSSSSGR